MVFDLFSITLCCKLVDSLSFFHFFCIMYLFHCIFHQAITKISVSLFLHYCMVNCKQESQYSVLLDSIELVSARFLHSEILLTILGHTRQFDVFKIVFVIEFEKFVSIGLCWLQCVTLVVVQRSSIDENKFT